MKLSLKTKQKNLGPILLAEKKMVFFVFIFSFRGTHQKKKKKKKLFWFKNLYLVVIFSILRVEFEYKKWKHFFSVFIFIENEYSSNSINTVKT